MFWLASNHKTTAFFPFYGNCRVFCFVNKQYVRRQSVQWLFLFLSLWSSVKRFILARYFNNVCFPTRSREEL